MHFIASLRRFFGFARQETLPKNASLVEQFASELKATSEDRKTVLVEQVRQRVEAESAALLAKAAGQAGQANDFFNHAKDHFALEAFLYQKASLGHGTGDEIDAAYERLLGRMVAYAEVFAKPSLEVINALDAYIQTFEDAIYIHEAQGNYSLAVSENGRWIRLPFLDKKTIKPGKRESAKKKLRELFPEAGELTLLELETHVPWWPISFLEFSEKAKGMRLALLYNPEGEKYYAYLYS